MVKATKKPENAEINIPEVSVGVVEVGILGTKPLILNSMSAKAKHELLLPRGRKTAADKAANLKHDPASEFVNSTYRHVGNAKPTRLFFPTPGFKGAMMTAALDIPGAKKAEIGRLVWVEDTAIDLYGIPELLMSVVRSADMNRTPDIRTRAIVPVWGTVLKISFVRPKVTPRTVINLLVAAGITCGVGDFRQEKGKGSFGQYEVCDITDERLKKLMKEAGRAAQDQALETFRCHDLESEELLEYYQAEIAKRSYAQGKSKRNADDDDVDDDEEVFEIAAAGNGAAQKIARRHGDVI